MRDDDRWLLLSVPAPPLGQELLMVDALRRAGARAVQPRGGRYEALFPGDDPAARVRGAERAIRAATTMAGAEIHWRWLDGAEWESRWREEQRPVRVTDRITVLPGYDDAAEQPSPAPPNPGEVVIHLGPTTAFGTAEHPTTRGCLRLLDRLVRPGDRVLDVGTGSGILAIAAARLGARRVLALEADPAACAAARRNVAANQVQDRVEVREREVAPRQRIGRYDGITANLQSDLLRPLLPTLAPALRSDGWLIVSGVLRSERDAVAADAATLGLLVHDEITDDGWWTAHLARA